MKFKRKKKKRYVYSVSLADHIKFRLDWKNFSYKVFGNSWEEVFKDDNLF